MVSESNKIGLLPAILMVAGNMMGSGVFMLPANLAGIGSIAIIGWLITVVGAIALGLVFAKLTEVTTAAGGPYAYARKAFGDYMGYQTNLVYWLANVIGNVGLAVAGLGYLTPFFPALRDPLVMALAQIAVIWFLPTPTFSDRGWSAACRASPPPWPCFRSSASHCSAGSGLIPKLIWKAGTFPAKAA